MHIDCMAYKCAVRQVILIFLLYVTNITELVIGEIYIISILLVYSVFEILIAVLHFTRHCINIAHEKNS